MPQQLTGWAEEIVPTSVNLFGGVTAVDQNSSQYANFNFVVVRDVNSIIRGINSYSPQPGITPTTWGADYTIPPNASSPHGFSSSSVPAACMDNPGSTTHNDFDVFAGVGLQQLHFFDGTWQTWAPLAAGAQNISLGVSAISVAPGQIDVYAVLVDKTASNIHYNGTSWSGWNSLGGAFITPPNVCSMNPNRQDLFIVNTSNQICQKTRGVTDWVPMQGPVLGKAVASICRADTTIDVFYIGMDNLLHYVFFSNGAWSPAITISQTPVIGPTMGVCTGSADGSGTPNNNRLDVYAVGTDSKLHHFYAGFFLPAPPQPGY